MDKQIYTFYPNVRKKTTLRNVNKHFLHPPIHHSPFSPFKDTITDILCTWNYLTMIGWRGDLNLILACPVQPREKKSRQR